MQDLAVVDSQVAKWIKLTSGNVMCFCDHGCLISSHTLLCFIVCLFFFFFPWLHLTARFVLVFDKESCFLNLCAPFLLCTVERKL